MSFFEKLYDFDTYTAPSNVEWEFINPNGTTGLAENGSTRRWNWEDKKTESSRTGPDKPYSGSGYIYTESSSPTKDYDQFVMVTKNAIDASDRNTGINFRYSADTDNGDVQLIVEVYSDGGWHKEYDTNIKSYSNDWVLVELDLSRYHNTDMLIRITVDMLYTGSTSRKDVGIDSIMIFGKDTGNDEMMDFLGVRDVRKLRKNINTFSAKHMDKTSIATVINELKLAKPSYHNYPKGVLIVETENIIHLIKEVD